jgi:hypothetical protein
MLSISYIQPKCDFTTGEVKEIILRMKRLKTKDYDGIPVEVEELFSTMTDGTDILTNTFNKIKNRKDFPPE